MALADVFERVAGPDAPVEFRAYDGSRAGAEGSAGQITVRSPTAVSYLAQAPGALGMARAYVAGPDDPRAECAGSGDLHAAGRPGDRRYQAALRHGQVLPRRRV